MKVFTWKSGKTYPGIMMKLTSHRPFLDMGGGIRIHMFRKNPATVTPEGAMFYAHPVKLRDQNDNHFLTLAQPMDLGEGKEQRILLLVHASDVGTLEVFEERARLKAQEQKTMQRVYRLRGLARSLGDCPEVRAVNSDIAEGDRELLELDRKIKDLDSEPRPIDPRILARGQGKFLVALLPGDALGVRVRDTVYKLGYPISHPLVIA